MHSKFRFSGSLFFLAFFFFFGPFQAARAQAPVNAQRLVSWWKADGDALDTVGENNGVLSGGVSFGPGLVNQGFIFDGTTGVVNIPDSPSLAMTGSFRITANVFLQQIPSYVGQIFFRGDDRDGLDPYFLDVDSGGHLVFTLEDASGNAVSIATLMPLQEWVFVDVSLDSVTGKMSMSLNHQLVSQTITSLRPFHYLDPASNPGIAIGNTQDPVSFNEPFNGTIDDVKVYSTPSITHVLWTNTNGSASLWNYNSASGVYTDQNYGPYQGLAAKAMADGGIDGLTRVLWDNANGVATLWNVDSTTGNFAASSFGPYAEWSAQAVSVAGDNTTHLLWTNANGTVALWNVQGGVYQGEHDFGPYSGWTAGAIADAPDGKTRLLWTNVNGQAAFWNINPATGDFNQFSFGPYPGWTAKSISADAATTHILWANTNGTSAVWNYDSVSGSFVQQLYGPYSGWSATAVADGGDGKVRLLWDNVNGEASFWELDNLTGLFSQFSFGSYSGWTAQAISAGP